MHSLTTEVKDFEQLEQDIINSANPRSHEMIKNLIIDFLESDSFRLESIIDNMISHNEHIFSLMADYLINNEYIDMGYDDSEDDVHTQTMDYIRDIHMGHNTIDIFENLIYETVMKNEIPLIIDLDSFLSFDLVVVRVSKEAKYIDTSNLDYRTNFHINHAQLTMFDMDDIKDGGCWHYGFENILIVDSDGHRDGRLLLKG